MWVIPKDSGELNLRAYDIQGVYSDFYDGANWLYGSVVCGNKVEGIRLGEYDTKVERVEAFERIMTAIVNKGSLVDLTKKF